MTPLECGAAGRRCAALLAFLALWLATAASADVAVPALRAHVTDLTGTLFAAQRSTLENDLQAIEARNGSQIAVLLVPSTQPEAIEEYSIRVAEAWKLGKKGVDNGMLLLVAKNDHKLRIEVGYGLEGMIPDAVARRVIDETITPLFKRGDYAGGLEAGVERLAAVIDGEKARAAPPGEPLASGPNALPMPSHSGLVMDLADTLSEEENSALSRSLNDFETSRGKPIFVLVVPSTQPETPARYAARILSLWGEKDNLDVDRSVLLLLAMDRGTAQIAAGRSLHEKLTEEASASIVADLIEPQLKKGNVLAGIQAGVLQVERLLDRKTFRERLIDHLRAGPIWLLVALIALGTVIRKLLGPLFGALATGGAVGAGAWYVAGTVEAGVAAALAAFVFVLVGLANWIAWGLSGSSGSGSSGGGGSDGFSGGGGSFGGGGASGSW